MRPIILAVLIVITVVIVVMSSRMHPMQTLEIAPRVARRHRYSLIVDVRTPKERETLGFYPNSIPIPLETLRKDVPALIGTGPAAKQKDILVYSNGDRRAHVAAEMLYAAGFTKVRYLTSAYDAMLPGKH